MASHSLYFSVCHGIVQLAKGYTGWLYSQDAEWGIDLPIKFSELCRLILNFRIKMELSCQNSVLLASEGING